MRTSLSLRRATTAAELLLVASVQFPTAPIGRRIIGRAADRPGTPLWDDTVRDELATRGASADATA